VGSSAVRNVMRQGLGSRAWQPELLHTAGHLLGPSEGVFHHRGSCELPFLSLSDRLLKISGNPIISHGPFEVSLPHPIF